MISFAALDFETATPSRDSACALGLCIISDGQIVERASWLIQPPGNDYSPFNTRVHGLGPHDTADAPVFEDVIDEAWELIGDLPLVAHNASFDISVLRNGLDMSGRAYPSATYYCTLVLSRARWPELPGYSLPLVLAKCGSQHRHHDALEDATAAAHILLRIASDARVDDLGGLERRYTIRPGLLDAWGYQPCSGPRLHRESPGRNEIPPGSDLVLDPDHPFYDADVAFTGTLLAMTREAAMELVASRGGRGRTSVSRFTEYLVVGSVEYRSLLTGEPSRKLQKALALREEGHPVEIISEQDFLEIL